jgi:hypothetical protein
MQGVISVLPAYLKESENAFRGVWSEADTFDNLAPAFEPLTAWLIDRKEVDDVPPRHVRRSGIG